MDKNECRQHRTNPDIHSDIQIDRNRPKECRQKLRHVEADASTSKDRQKQPRRPTA